MNNVLLCFLGIEKYKAVYYTMEGRSTQQEETYVPAALVELLSVPNLHVRVLVTKEARETHWESLSERLRELGVDSKRLKPVDIEVPTSENAFWTIFEEVLDNIDEGDHVWFDITHGFRALPVAAVLALTFARNVKRFTVKGLLYGAFDKNTKTAPVFDLTGMVTLPAWAESLAEWKRTGRADGIVQQTKPYLSQVQRQKRQATALTGIPDALQQVSDALTMVRHDVPGSLAESAIKQIEEVQVDIPNHPSMKPLGFILGPLKRDLEELRGIPKYDPDSQQAKAAVIDETYLRRLVKTGRWFLKRKRLAEGSTTLRETITASAVRLVRHSGVDEIMDRDKLYPWHHEKFRTSVDWSLQVLSGAERMPKDFSTSAPQNNVISNKLENNELREAAREAFVTLRSLRNKVNHAWSSGEHTKEAFNGSSASGFLEELQNAAVAVDRLVELTIAATGDADHETR